MENNEDRKLVASFAMNDVFIGEDIQIKAASMMNRIIKVRKRKKTL